MSGYLLTEQAERDLNEIWAHRRAELRHGRRGGRGKFARHSSLFRSSESWADIGTSDHSSGRHDGHIRANRCASMAHTPDDDRPAEAVPPRRWLKEVRRSSRVEGMIHENISQAIEDLSSRMIAIRDSL